MALRRTAHAAWRRIGDETVIIHLKDKRVFVLNPSGGFFWHRLDGAREPEEMIDLLPSPWSREQKTEALRSFIAELASHGLLEPVDVTGGPEAVGSWPAPDLSRDLFPPQVIWQEEVRNFGASCAFLPGQNATCDAAPTT